MEEQTRKERFNATYEYTLFKSVREWKQLYVPGDITARSLVKCENKWSFFWHGGVLKLWTPLPYLFFLPPWSRTRARPASPWTESAHYPVSTPGPSIYPAWESPDWFVERVFSYWILPRLGRENKWWVTKPGPRGASGRPHSRAGHRHGMI